MMQAQSPMVRCCGILAVMLSASFVAAQDKRRINFNRDIRPILSDACFQCHGPDKSKRKAGLNLDTAEGARADLGGHAAIVPGKPEQSALLERISSKEASRRMPPPKSGAALKPEQIELLRRWIAEGAKYEKHWSFLPPVRAELPKVKHADWPRTPIDHFILERLEREGLTPAPEADRITLLRRVSLDLTGLPPTPAEVDAFLADKSPAAYEKVVDRLLASPRFGERMAHRWLDAARYADTNGYQTDGDRVMWRWRDWVIEAFNKGVPFDQFTIEQIAGDMLPGATLEQKLATGFNRNHRGNSEGGVIPEEYAVEYVVDRVDTTATVWLGLTAGCAKCHTHKYDPITQKEFYQLFAYFNNVPERGKAIKYGNSPPYIKTPTREQEVKWAWHKKRLEAAEATWAGLQREISRRLEAWEDTIQIKHSDWLPSRGLQHHLPLEDLARRPAGSTIAPGRIGNALHLDGSAGLTVAKDIGDFGFFDRFTIMAWIEPQNVSRGSIVSRMADTDRAEGYNIVLQGDRIHVHLIKRWLDDAIRVETVEPVKAGDWTHVAVTYDGSRLASGLQVFLNGRRAKLKVNLDDLNQSFATKEPLRLGQGGGADSRFKGAIDEVRIYNRVVSAEDIGAIARGLSVTGALGLGLRHRHRFDEHLLRSYYIEKDAPEFIKEAHKRLLQARDDLADFEDAIPTTMVMEEMPTPRDTHILLRGEYDKPGAKVGPGLPEFLPSMPKGALNNRLGFARWLVDPANPLTARVTVNRYWQMLFGTGIVKSVEDFGAQGEWPSHPELLDWLSVEFMEPAALSSASGERARGEGVRPSRWDIKHLLKTIVTSATYRQSSRVTKELAARDPDNRLLARGPRVRLPAEIVRDQALFASGLLTEKLGGPSIRPYQPPGLIKELHGTDDYVQDHGPSLYRRSLYVHWKRTVPPPGLTTFDAAGREACVVRETRTNTPLQALYLLNDITNVEAARVLAQRVMQEAGDEEQRIRLAFRLATCRPPSDRERGILRAGLAKHLQHYGANPEAARKLTAMGEYPLPGDVDVVQLAGYTALANTILNLDEVITKE